MFREAYAIADTITRITIDQNQVLIIHETSPREISNAVHKNTIKFTNSRIVKMISLCRLNLSADFLFTHFFKFLINNNIFPWDKTLIIVEDITIDRPPP